MSHTPFEKPADEFRQVRALVCEPSGAASFYHYVVQRKWIVQNGEGKPIPWNESPPAGWVLIEKGNDGYFPWYAPSKEVWKDLPIVDERDV